MQSPFRPKLAPNFGLLLIVLAAGADSLSGLFTRLVATDTWTMIFWRGIFAASFVFVFALIKYRRNTIARFLGMGWMGLLLVFINASGMVAGLQSMRLTAVANFFIIFATAPFAAALLARITIGEKLDSATLISAIAGFAGVFIMMSGSAESGNLAGDLLACTVVIFYSFLVLIVRRHNVVEVEAIIVLTVLVSSLLALPLASPWAVSAADFKLLVPFGVIQLGLGNILIFNAARRIPAAQSGLLGVLNCALAPLWVWIFLREIPPPATLVGGSLVIAAAVVHIGWHMIRSARSSQPAPAL